VAVAARLGTQRVRPGRVGDLRAGPELAMQYQGETVYPVCFRDASELRSLDAEPEAGS
jgi:hypothetical protein